MIRSADMCEKPYLLLIPGFVCGKQDILTPPELSEEIAENVSDARLHIIEDCGHLTTMERPAAVNAVMRQWLTFP